MCVYRSMLIVTMVWNNMLILMDGRMDSCRSAIVLSRYETLACSCNNSTHR